jgi:hypothetical protein
VIDREGEGQRGHRVGQGDDGERTRCPADARSSSIA